MIIYHALIQHDSYVERNDDFRLLKNRKDAKDRENARKKAKKWKGRSGKAVSMENKEIPFLSLNLFTLGGEVMLLI